MVERYIEVVLSFGLCFLLTPRVRAWAWRLRLVDRPDGRRKLHDRSIPAAGGPVILFSVGVAVLAAFLCSDAIRSQALTAGPRLLGLLLAGLLICAVGVIDDLGRLRGRHKLVGQLAAIAVAIASGVRIDSVHLFHLHFDLGIMAIPFTTFFLLGAINSLNLLDGMDGLLSSVALILCLVLGSLALHAGKDLTACVAFAMAAALLAFLRYNFPPATIFLGDSGSMLIGLVVGILAIKSSHHPVTGMALAAPVALLTLPILDTLAAILRRKLTGRSIYSTDRSHLHHCLLHRFGDPRLVLFVIALCCATIGAGVLVGGMLGSELATVLTSLSVVVALIGTRLFGHAELRMASQRLGALLTSLLRMQPADEPRQIEMRLQGTVDWHELWQRIISWDTSLNLCRLRLDVNAPAIGEGYHARWARIPETSEEDERLWHAQIPLEVKGRSLGELAISGRRDGEPIGDKIAVLAQMVHDFEYTISLLTDGVTPAVATSQASGLSTLRGAGREEPELHRAGL